MKIVVVTNNPKVLEHGANHKIIINEAKTIPEVLIKSRDLIHNNYKLVNHPLATSIKPYENLYKTVVLEKSEKLHYQSVEIIENAIIKGEQFKRPARINDQAQEDYKTIDLGIFLETIQQSQ